MLAARDCTQSLHMAFLAGLTDVGFPAGVGAVRQFRSGNGLFERTLKFPVGVIPHLAHQDRPALLG